MKLLQELFANGIINEQLKAELENEISKTGKTAEDLVLEKKICSESTLFQIKSNLLKMPLRQVKAEDIPLEILELIGEEAATNYKMAPLEKKDNVAQIGMVYPDNAEALNALRFLSRQQNFSYQISLITFTDLNNLLKQYRTLKSETKKALEELNKEKFGGLEAPLRVMENALVDEAPIIKMVLVILKHAIEGNASDIHIEPGREKLLVRFRQDGILHSSLFLPLSVHAAIAARIKIISGLKIDETRLPQDGRFSTKIRNQDIDFRVATFPALYGEKVEIRVLDPREGLKSFEDLGLRGRNLEIVSCAIEKSYGLILTTGPTGSGKTTTQYALMKILNKDSVNIVTVEDPIEYSLPGVNQSQVKPEIGYTFASGLRQILRQDPDIIMVGEIRDEETADLMVHAALTGHIVLSTLHTNSSSGVAPRLIDMGVRPFLIPSVLRVVISQRLVRKLCPSCKIKARPSEKIKTWFSKQVKNLPRDFYIYQAKGCQICNFKGYSGRMGIFEVMQMTSELADIILKNPLESLILKQAQKQGMLTMEQEGISKVLSGETSVEEVATAISGI